MNRAYPDTLEITSSDAIPLREFRLAAKYRRCGWYGLVGCIGLLAVAAALHPLGLLPNIPGWTEFAVRSAVLWLPVLGLFVLIHRWRVRLDDVGISRRRFWG